MRLHPRAAAGHPTAVRPRAALVLAALLAIVVLSACGSGDDATGDRGSATAATAEEGAFPVTIASRFGDATIAAAPRRVVALDYAAADGAIALGAPLVAMPRVSGVPGGIQSWRADALRGTAAPALLDLDAEIPIERIAALRPDLILATNTYLLDATLYARLSEIAPTVHFAGAPLTDTWQQSTLRIGSALGREARAQELVDAAERDVRVAARRRAEAFEGRSFAVFLASPDGLGTVTDPGDAFVRFLSDLGMRLDPKVQTLGGDGGRALLSKERYDLLDTDLLVGSAVTPQVLAEVERAPTFAPLRVVREGRYVALGFEPVTALTLPSALSVRWAAREVVPQLASAAMARG
ncbi:ABC transporter substrate-binding protein [Conexibacter woesei]|uniref:ABC transporter substrate-binding protein n=1 Tax=Conexibacter woesei TaxID=191495 RepID=UPI0002E8D022|nr:ABC transporter substrate-binding protein [Conexibacter woesei]